MHIEPGRQGRAVTNHLGKASYQSFRPAPLQDVLPTIQLDQESVNLLSASSRAIGGLAGMTRFVPNAEMYLTMYVRKEALLSAQIEGTQCTFDDVLNPTNATLLHKDVSDVVNYVSASVYAAERMRDLPLCTKLLRETHARLLQGVRGSDKQPGEVRTSQNWIGPAGCSIMTASYLPPNVEDMKRALSDLDVFINGETKIDPLMKAALVHYQFETIHPFLDGNGRLGRLLITLSLMNDQVFRVPIFYPSYYLKRHRHEYYDMLTAVREHGEYERWIAFFCRCMRDAAQDATRSLEALATLHERSVQTITETLKRGAANGLKLLELLEAHPFVDIAFVMQRLEISRSSAASLVKEFVAMSLLAVEDEHRQRYRTYVYEPYMAILREGDEPLR